MLGPRQLLQLLLIGCITERNVVLTVTGGGGVGECGRYEAGFWAHRIVILMDLA